MVVVFLSTELDNVLLILGVIALGTAIAVPASRLVKMTQMPQLVALFNGVGGGAAAAAELGLAGLGGDVVALGEDRPGEAGWSAQDLGHLLLWLRIVADRKPYLASYIDRIIQRWTFCEALAKAGINIEMINTSEVCMGVVIDAARGAEAVAALKRLWARSERIPYTILTQPRANP